MLQRKGKRWKLYPHKVSYSRNGEEFEQWALPSRQWWETFSEKWSDTEIIEFTEMDLSEEQIARFKEIENMPEDFLNVYVEYTLTGDKSIDVELPLNHPFSVLRLKKENEELRMNLSLSTMEAFNALSAVSMKSEIDQAVMMMEVLMMIENLQGGD